MHDFSFLMCHWFLSYKLLFKKNVEINRQRNIQLKESHIHHFVIPKTVCISKGYKTKGVAPFPDKFTKVNKVSFEMYLLISKA